MRRERTLQKWVPLRILKLSVQNREKFLHTLKLGPTKNSEFDSNKILKICKLLYNLGYFRTMLVFNSEFKRALLQQVPFAELPITESLCI